MKEDKSKGRSQQDQSAQDDADAQLPSFHADGEDVDFEILDALEQIEQAGKSDEEASPDEDSAVELNLEDDEFIFDEDEVAQTEKFRVDDETISELGISTEGFTGDVDEFNFNESLGEDIEEDVHAETDKEGTFSVDYDHEDEHEMDLSFDDDFDLDLNGTLGDTSFDEEAESDVGEISETPSFDMEPETFEEESKEAQDDSFDFDEEDADMMLDAEWSDTEEMPELDEDEVDEETDEIFGDVDFDNLPEMEEALESESHIEDDSTSREEFSDMNGDHETEDFPGKAVISIDGDQVIDLGDESELEQQTSEHSWEDEEAEFDLADLEKGAQELVGGTEAAVAEENEDEDNFMASLDDIDIDLEEDTSKILDTFEGEEDMSDFDTEDLAVSEEPEDTEISISEADIDIPALNEMLAETAPEFGEESAVSPEEEAVAEAEEPEVDEREALGLTPRLTDAEIDRFECMVIEAKTLQNYMEELEEHKTEVKESIYQKLLKEYASRKTDIFREPEFISIRIDVEQDLQDMLAKRDEFVDTVTRLNDELEEVKVRHLVGEFTDEMLARKEAEQKTEIEEWQDKTERLGAFVTRYQELLSTEQALNPLDEEAPDEEIPEEPQEELLEEPQEDLQEEAALPEEEPEAIPSIEDLAQIIPAEEPSEEMEPEAEIAEFPGEPSVEEEPEEDEEIDMSLEDLPDELEDLESLTNIFDDEDNEDWDASENEDIELTTEEFDSQDFSIEAGLEEEEDFEIDDVANTEEDLDESIADFGDEIGEEDIEQEEMIDCKKCGRSTPASEKFCVNCGAKAR